MNGDDEYQGMIAQAGADGLFVDGSVEEMVLYKMP
jgi:prepilin-type processing-associated H-X9-DG protein